MQILAERGYLIPAIDTESVDYLSCAVHLAKSIRQWHPAANIAVISTKRCSDPVFDHVIPLPYGDQKGYANDWNGLSNNGNELPDGTYFIVVDLNMEGKENVKGSIDIKRK